MSLSKYIYIICLHIIFGINIGAQQREIGFPIVKQSTDSEFIQLSDIRNIVQGNNGFLYISQGQGVIEFDGSEFRILKGNEGQNVFHVAAGKDGTLYTASFDSLGRFVVDESNSLVYQSLNEYIPIDFQHSRIYQDILPTSFGVFFKTYHELFFWQEGQVMDAWNLINPLPAMFYFQGKAIISSDAHGLLVFNLEKIRANPNRRLSIEEAFDVLPGSEFLIEDLSVESATEGPDGMLYLATQHRGIYRYDGNTFTHIETVLDRLNSLTNVKQILYLQGGMFAIATDREGLYILDQDFNLFGHYNHRNGLLDNTVLSFLQDDFGGLWLVQNKGLCRLEAPSPFEFFDDRNGLAGPVEALIRYEGHLYVGTSLGLFRSIIRDSPEATIFEAVEYIDQPCRTLIPTESGLLIGSVGGLYLIKDDKITELSSEDGSYLWLSRVHPNRLYVGSYQGLHMWEYGDGEWKPASRFPEVKGFVHGLIEGKDGHVWLTTGHGQIRRVDLEKKPLGLYLFNETHGLPQKEWIKPLGINGTIIFACGGEGIFQYDPNRNIFERSERYSYFPATVSHDFMQIVQAPDETIWVSYDTSGELLSRPAGPYNRGLNILSKKPLAKSNAFYEDADGIIWFGIEEGILRYDPRVSIMEPSGLNTYLRGLKSLADNKILNGFVETVEAPIVLPFIERSLRFQFTVPDYRNPSRTRYQYLLEGFDQNWSSWSSESWKDYTNLPPGDYTFHVRSMDPHDNLSEEAGTKITVLPPWYRTKLAYLMYGILNLGGLFFVIKWRSNHLEVLNEELQNVVAERTRRITQQAQELHEKNSALADGNEKLKYAIAKAEEASKAKTIFLANMSHEIRTPMNGVMGMASLLETTNLSQEQKRFVSIVRNSGEKLLSIISSILDFSKIEAGRQELESIPLSLEMVSEEVLGLFSGRAYGKGLELFYRIDPDIPKNVIGDPNRLSQILSNLIGNAVKFTEKGYIQLNIEKCESQSDGEELTIRFTVKDTGIGIPKERRYALFEPFSQVDSSTTRRFGGTGLGLAICKQLVLLMGGNISFVSKLGEGTQFIAEIPFIAEKDAPPIKLSKECREPLNLLICSPSRGLAEVIAEQCSNWGHSSQINTGGMDSCLKYLSANSVNVLLYDIENKKEQVSDSFFDAVFELSQRNGFNIIATRSLESEILEVNQAENVVDIPKPISWIRLAQILNELTGDRSRRLNLQERELQSGAIKENIEKNWKILVVEDNEVNQEVTLELLRYLKFQADLAINAKQGIEMASQTEYDIIIMDVQMPEINGREATVVIKKQSARPPVVIAMTAAATVEDKLACEAAGMDHYLSKPVRLNELAELFDKIAAKKLSRV